MTKISKTYRLSKMTLAEISMIRRVNMLKYEMLNGKRSITGTTEEPLYKSDAEIIERAIDLLYYKTFGFEYDS